jgi:uncharacterized protein YjbJ (UPF0337 family)
MARFDQAIEVTLHHNNVDNRPSENCLVPDMEGVTMVDKKKVQKSVGTATTHAKNAAQVAKGKVKSTTGKVVGDHRLQAEGKIDEAKGRVKQAGQKVKETLKK